jgi:hypothetical protein
MTDVRDLRARARETSYEPEQKSSLPFWLITAVAVTAGFALVMFAPRFLGSPRTVAYVEVAHAPAAAIPLPPGAERYAGKKAEEIEKIADAYCAERAGSILLAPVNGEEQSPKAKAEFERAKQTVVSGRSVTDHNERLACQLTEAPARYCSRALRQKITAGIIDYFRGIENTNMSLRLYYKAQSAITLDTSRGRINAEALGSFTADPRVTEGVERLIRMGYLLKPQRDDIATSVPRAVKERLDRVVGNNAHCPEAPWWAFWK